MQLDELMFIVDCLDPEELEAIELVQMKVFDLGPQACSPRGMLQEGIPESYRCKSWEDLRVLEEDRIGTFRNRQKMPFDAFLRSKCIFRAK